MSITLLSSGSNAQGQLANATLEDSHNFGTCLFADSVTLYRVLQLANGANHTLLLAEVVDGPDSEIRTQLYGCGDGTVGQLGIGVSTTSVFRPVDLQLQENGLEGYQPRLISASWQTTYIVLSCSGRPDRLIVMGSDDFGDLGIGGVKGSASASGSEGTSPPFYLVRFNHLLINGAHPDDEKHLSIDLVTAGQHHVVVHFRTRLTDGSYRHLTAGWGTCRHGQLGASESISDNKSKKQKPLSFVSEPKLVFVDRNVTAIALGSQHSLFMDESGHLHGIGSNKRGQLNGLNELECAEVGCTWNGTYVIDKQTQTMHATGSHSKGQLGRVSIAECGVGLGPVEFPFRSVELPPSIRQLGGMACGSEHVLVLFDSEGSCNREVWGWGWNEHGNLGIGSTEDIPIPVKIWPPGDTYLTGAEQVVGIWAGCGTSWIAVKKLNGWTHGRISRAMLNFLGAGHETTASGLTWTLWSLANNKNWRQKLREEAMPFYELDETRQTRVPPISRFAFS
ncbi:RCC1/BLIP-II [Marasmius fiardii PR-910]|nr:RCC1/BLIP-II [Marasmius fiardii PR-910]